MASGKSSRRGSGGTSGADSGEDSGEDRPPVLPIDDFVAECLAHRDALSPRIIVMRAGPDGGATGGARMGLIALDPIDTLEDRVAEEFSGHHVLRLQARTTAGRWFRVGELALANGPRGATPSAPANEGLLAEVLKRLDKPASDPMAQLTSMVGLVKGLIPGASSTTEQLAAAREHAKQLKEMAQELAETQVPGGSAKAQFAAAVAKPLGELLSGIAANLAAKAATNYAALEEHEARKKAREKRATEEEARKREEAIDVTDTGVA